MKVLQNSFREMNRYSDEYWMRIALEAAQEAEKIGEVPVGACLVDENENLLSVAGNRTINYCDPTAHAEILVLRDAAKKLGNYRLINTTIYTTIEPCAMCAGALVQARVKRLVFAAHDERFGAVESLFQICSSLNHQIEISSGTLAEESRNLIQNFFRRRRLEKQKLTESL